MKKQSRYFRTVENKLDILDYARLYSVGAAARRFGCAEKSIKDWRREEEELRAATSKRETRSLHQGRKTSSAYAEIEDALYDWIIDKRSKGKSVTIPATIIKVKSMKASLKTKSDNAIRCLLRRFARRHFLAYRKPTHVGQSLPEDYQKRIEDFKESLAKLKADHNVSDDRIVNMDEVPLYYEPASTRVLSLKGAKTVTLTQSQAGQRRVTLVLGVGYDGSKLPPMLIFRGEFG